MLQWYVPTICSNDMPVADDSGYWGRGGLFSAISARSEQPQKQYELAGRVNGEHVDTCLVTVWAWTMSVWTPVQ